MKNGRAAEEIKKNYDKRRRNWNYSEGERITVFIKKNVYPQATFQTRRKAMLDDLYIEPFQATILLNQTV